MLTIDGLQGEGGGQILRSSLSLAIATATPFRIVNIRARRKKSGLRRQHLTAVLAAARISGARVEGAELGSRELDFVPGPVAPGEYRFSIGTAGSASLVLQTLLPPLVTASGPSRITVEGGTHNPNSPPFEFLERAFIPLLNRLGCRVTVTLRRAGFFPAGGGRLTATIQPVTQLSSFELLERGELLSRRASATVANLPRHIAERELQVIREQLAFGEEELEVRELTEVQGPGNVVIVELRFRHISEVFSGFGRKGVRAEAVADEVVGAVQRYLVSPAPVGAQLADQLLLPLALAGGGNLLTLPLTSHSQTNLAVIQQFLPLDITVESRPDGSVLLKLSQFRSRS